MPRVVHFEIHAEVPERAIAFYGGLFGWEFRKYGGGAADYWLITTGVDGERGIDGGLVKRTEAAGRASPAAFVCTIDVPSVDGVVDAVVSNGGAVARPRIPIPGIGWLAYCKDPDGNVFGVMQEDPAAS